MAGAHNTNQPDSFELERPLQPKSTVADYVESQEVLVPYRFDNFDEAEFAARNRKAVIARSEHPDEYSGPSGMGFSSQLVFEDGIIQPRHRAYGRSSADKFRYYALAAGVEGPDEYVALASESYWQAIPGINVTCVADDAIEGRYHVFGFKHEEDSPTLYAGVIAEENGDVLRAVGAGSEDFTSRLKDIIDFYNNVRVLERFNPDHCPIMEMQISDEDDQLYFLQYHRARDAAYQNERLNEADYDERDGWVKADAVRGAYLGGKALKLAMWYSGVRTGHARAANVELPEDGSTSVDISFWMLNEAIGRQRTAHLISSNFNKEYSKIAANHGPRSWMFKPQVSMLTNPPEGGSHIREDLKEEALQLGVRENKEVRIETDVVSDGHVGYFRYGDELIVSD